MPRANRYFIPGQVYHLTHRCHDRRFFKFARDRNAYRLKLREAVEMENRIRGRQQLTIERAEGLWTLREAVAPYGSFSEGQNAMQRCL